MHDRDRFKLIGGPYRMPRCKSPRAKPVNWTPALDRKLGTMSDVDLAAKLGCTVMMVQYRRHKLGIAAFRR